MKQGKYAAPVKRRRRRRNPLKPVLIAMAVVLLLGCAAGSTLAWLTSSTAPVTNTFTVGNISISLSEPRWDASYPDGSAKMIPGCDITKDPVVTVDANSEKCYLFVKVTKSSNFDNFMTYQIANGWMELSGQTGIYYCEVDASDSKQEFGVLKDNKVTVPETVTKASMDEITQGNEPTLSVKAAAVQYFQSNEQAFQPDKAYEQVQWTTS